MRAENLIQMFLLGSEIFAFARLAQPKQITIKMQARFRIRDSNRGVIDTEEKLVRLFLPTRIAFARRKIDDLEIVLVGITKIKCFDSSGGGERCRQRLGPSRDELHFERAQFFKCLVHVAHDNRDMLKPKIVAARIHWNRPPARCEILSEIDKFISELHPHDAHPRAKNAFQMFVLLSENFDVRDFLKRERGIERHRAIHVAHRHADRFDRDLRRICQRSQREYRESKKLHPEKPSPGDKKPDPEHQPIRRQDRRFLTPPPYFGPRAEAVYTRLGGTRSALDVN